MHCLQLPAAFALVIYLDCPLFVQSSTYHVYEHVIGLFARLPAAEVDCLARPLVAMPLDRLWGMVSRVEQFLSVRLFASRSGERPSSITPWHVAAAVMSLRHLHSANTARPRLDVSELRVRLVSIHLLD